MKKLLLVAVVSIFAFTNANAQTEKVNWMFGGDTSISFNSTKSTYEYDGEEDGDTTLTNISFTPSANYFVIDNLAIGLGFNFSSRKYGYDGEHESKFNSISIIPNATFFFESDSVVPFIGAGAGLMYASYGDEDSQKQSGLAIMAEGGIAYFLSNSVSINFGVEFLTSTLTAKENDKSKQKATGLGVGVGFAIFL